MTNKKKRKKKQRPKHQLVQKLNFKELENEKLKIDLSINEVAESEVPVEGGAALLKDSFDFLNRFLENISTIDINDDQAIFQKALGCFEEAQQKEFIVHNLLEAVKKGEPLSKVMKDYSKLGIVDEKQVHGIVNMEIDAEADTAKSGGFLINKVLKGLKKIGTILIKIMRTALKKLGSPIQIIVGLNSIFMPTVQFAFDPKKGILAISGEDVLDIIQKNW